MQDLNFRKKLIWTEIEKIKSDLEKNQEFISLFQKNNNKLLTSLSDHFKELEKIGHELYEKKNNNNENNFIGYVAGNQIPEPTFLGEKSLQKLTTGDTIGVGNVVFENSQDVYCTCKNPDAFAWQCITCNKPINHM